VHHRIELLDIGIHLFGCCGICCKIGDYAFYFLDFDEDVLLEEFWTKYSKEEEQGYYEGLLKSN